MPAEFLVVPARAESEDRRLMGDALVRIEPGHPDWATWQDAIAAGLVERGPDGAVRTTPLKGKP